MKKITLLVLFLSMICGYSQVKNYTFTQTAGTFTEATGGTLLGSSSSDDMFFVGPGNAGGYGATGVGFPIGFNFVFNGFTYDRFAVATEGWISLGTSTKNPSVNTDGTDLRSPMDSNKQVTEDLVARIVALGANLAPLTGATLLFKTTGTTPNQVLTVQWKNYRKNLSAGSFTFQINLYETSNKVEIVYGSVTSASTSGTYQVGLRATPSTTGSNFVNRTSVSGWDNTTAGTSTSDSVFMNSTFTPSSGLTFTWTPPTCEAPKNLVTSAITASSATLNWDYYSQVPTGYEYVVTTSSDLPIGSGTATTAATASVTGLTPNTGYNVFMRSACGNAFSNWILMGAFRTQCVPTATFADNFDSYPTGVGVNMLPNCWAKGGNGDVFVAAGSSGGANVASAPNALYIGAKTTGTPTVAYAIMPKVNTLQLNTYRLKFKLIPISTGGSLDFGYFTDSNDVSTYVSLQTITLPVDAVTSAIEFEIVPSGIPAGASCLGFKNSGQLASNNSGYLQVYVDDVVWEPNPPCSDVKAIAVNVLSTSAKMTWTPKGTETAWQYVYGPSTVQDPSTLTMTPIDVAGSAQTTVSGLAASTSYKVWVRSNCGHGAYGYWIGPVNFTTTCAPVTEFARSFYSSSSFPPCWRKVGAGGLASVGNPNNTPSDPSVLYMVGFSTISKAVVAMEPVSNAGAGDHRLKFKFRGDEIGDILEVGYLTNIDDDNSFVSVQSYTTTSITDYQNVTAVLGSAPTTPYLAFRVAGSDVHLHLYINDVVWEPIPKCSDVSALSMTSLNSDSVDVTWTAGGTESQWQYVVGPSATTNPYSLSATDFALSPVAYGSDVYGTINGLTSLTTYKIWIRSKCNSSAFGAWIGPLAFTTPCAPVTDFIQNFDSANALPPCWTKVGTGGSVSVTATVAGPSAPNVLSVYSSSGLSAGMGIVAIAPVSNADEGSHRLRFKFRGSVANEVLEVGYLAGVGDSVIFYQLKTFTATTDFTEVIADLGTAPGSQILAFRNSGNLPASIYIDDVVWEPIPACANVNAFNVNSVSSTSVDLAWIAGGSEKAWQYVVGGPTVSDPSTLTSPVTVTASEITVNGLTPSTSYKIWVRSKCGTAKYGAWVGAVAFTTTCGPVAEFTQNFDSTSDIPKCWSKLAGTVSVANAPADAPSSPYVVSIASGSDASLGVLAMQPVSNAGAGDHRLRFKFKGSVVGAGLEVGYLINPLDANSFHSFQTYSASSTTAYDIVKVIPVVDPKIQVLAFRNPAHPLATVYIDDVVWEPVPPCPDINSVAVTSPMSDSVNLSWVTDGTATAWQYVVGNGTDPNSFTPVDVASASAKATNLTASINYNVWVRTKCGTSSFGSWSNPVSFRTLCASVASFTEKFDVNTAIPDCWRQVGALGTVTVNAVPGASSPNVLALIGTTTAKAVVALPNVNNISAGTQRLKFKFSSSVANGALEVGYVTDVNDQSTFVPLQSYAASSTSAFDTKSAVLGTKPVAGSILALRNPGTPVSTIYVDDVVWEAIPPCADVANIVTKLPTDNSVQLSWDATGTETAWQYAYAPSTVTDPSTLLSTSIFDIASKTAAINGLTPNTSYKVWVRSNCGNGAYGYWIQSAVFSTPCPSVQTITESFDASSALPSCWNLVGTNGTVAVAPSKGSAGTNALEVTTPAANTSVFVAIPPLSTAVTGGYRMRFKCKSAASGGKIDIVCYKDPINVNGTASFTILKTISLDTPTIQYTFDDIFPVAETAYLGFRVYNTMYSTTTIDIDDFVWQSSLPTTCATGIVATPDTNCGNYGTAISWNAAPNAAGYLLTIGTTSGGTDVLNNLDIGNVLAYSIKGRSNTKYYFTLVPYNSIGSATGCAEQSFATVANSCYCISASAAVDGTGITNVLLGTTNFANGDVTYTDFTASKVDLTQGGHFNLQLSLNTDAYGYYTNVWIDSNDNFEFEPLENVFTGKAATHGPNVFDASFELPTMGLGAHTMRIGATRFLVTPADPCYNGFGAVTLDFKLNIVAKALGINSFDESNFSYYPNPVKDLLNLSFDQEIGNVSVVNLLGQQVISKTLNANQGKIDMSGLTSGAYLVKVTSGDQSKTIKVVKE